LGDAGEGMVVLILNGAGGDLKIVLFKENGMDIVIVCFDITHSGR
jgi:hypothetical protein